MEAALKIVLLVLLTFLGGGDSWVGDDQTCRTCHPSQYAGFKDTAMGRSMARPDRADPLGDFVRRFDFHSPDQGRHYSAFEDGEKYYHRESQKDAAGNEIYSDTREVAWSVGAGITGRSYLIREGDRLYMSPISFYTRIRGWDLSPGYREVTYHGFTRPVSEQCLVCHAGQVRAVQGSPNNFLDPPFGALAIACERCHGPGAKHVELNRGGKVEAAVASIVNPRRLQGQLRDGICDQCHLRGDARVLKPGRSAGSYRPGELLDETVAVFSVPADPDGEVFPGTSHATMLRSSRCRQASDGKLGCISCHNPHKEPSREEKPDYYRARCLECHTARNCAGPGAAREATKPADNCISCHMPPLALLGIPHSAATDHRIRRTPGASSGSPVPGKSSDGLLIHETASGGAPPDLRTLALAYAQVSGSRPSFRSRGYPLLEEAAREFPADREVQETFGLIQFLISSSVRGPMDRAREALEKAVSLGSQSGLVHLRLAEILVENRNYDAARKTLERGLELEPHMAPIALRLSELYISQGDSRRALEAVMRALKYDPGHADLRQIRSRLTVPRSREAGLRSR
jgi:hypothetical protein